ncbi:transcriptional repressor [Litoribacter ruber]|uniref:Transcriptional repressor n=1 Tax=Litoribacter ruber TaxID=702568 RepID=A0AAP2G230_9BACT|nr:MULTISPECIES: transcriptional repressor [Litoribacter]MBS9525544.1 transcriptional repressor [Litoribacter alkaliphilus]MBT0812793.1 transcriptional repressor [Litoribacter ruber]
MNIEGIKNIITKGGLKFTHQRMVIYNAIAEAKNHPTAEHVFEQIKSDNPSISLGTVYKTLDTFVTAGIIQKFVDNKGVMRFDGILEAHSHLYCKKTNEISDYKNAELEALLTKFFDKNQIEDFDIDEISIVIKGQKL